VRRFDFKGRRQKAKSVDTAESFPKKNQLHTRTTQSPSKHSGERCADLGRRAAIGAPRAFASISVAQIGPGSPNAISGGRGPSDSARVASADRANHPIREARRGTNDIGMRWPPVLLLRSLTQSIARNSISKARRTAALRTASGCNFSKRWGTVVVGRPLRARPRYTSPGELLVPIRLSLRVPWSRESGAARPRPSGGRRLH